MKHIYKTLAFLVGSLLLIGLPEGTAPVSTEECSAVAYMSILEADKAAPRRSLRRYHLDMGRNTRPVEVKFRHKTQRRLQPGFVRVIGKFNGKEFSLTNDHPAALHEVPAVSASTSCKLSAATAAAAILPTAVAAATGTPLSVPALSSKPSAIAKLYLDFDGDNIRTWGSYTISLDTYPFDTDGNRGSFSDRDLTAINEIWKRVAEAYSPFNIDVTTVKPTSFAEKAALRVVIGGNGSWMGGGYGGVAYVGGFYNSSPNAVFVFTDNLGMGQPRYVAEAISHEAGHAFGLEHQSTFSSTGRMTDEYNSGNELVAPIMGDSYYAKRGIWFYGPAVTATSYQDDVRVLAGDKNGFGYVSEDVGDTVALASNLPAIGNTVFVEGLISTIADRDVYAFVTRGGHLWLSIAPAPFKGMLDSKASLLDQDGKVLVSSDSESLGETLETTLAEGTYYLEVSSHGAYGDIGTYSVSGSIENIIGSCEQHQPSLIVQSSNSAAYRGTTLSYDISLINNDSFGCIPATFTLSVSGVNGATSTLRPDTVTLAPGGTSTGRLDLAIGADSIKGTYGFTVTATNRDSPTFYTVGSTSYTVQYDTIRPSAPSNLSYAYSTETGRTILNWNASTDNVGVVSYLVRRDDQFVAETTGTSYELSGAGWNSSFAIWAMDAARNVSYPSNVVRPRPTINPRSIVPTRRR